MSTVFRSNRGVVKSTKVQHHYEVDCSASTRDAFRWRRFLVSPTIVASGKLRSAAGAPTTKLTISEKFAGSSQNAPNNAVAAQAAATLTNSGAPNV